MIERNVRKIEEKMFLKRIKEHNDTGVVLLTQGRKPKITIFFAFFFVLCETNQAWMVFQEQEVEVFVAPQVVFASGFNGASKSLWLLLILACVFLLSFISSPFSFFLLLLHLRFFLFFFLNKFSNFLSSRIFLFFYFYWKNFLFLFLFPIDSNLIFNS